MGSVVDFRDGFVGIFSGIGDISCYSQKKTAIVHVATSAIPADELIVKFIHKI